MQIVLGEEKIVLNLNVSKFLYLQQHGKPYFYGLCLCILYLICIAKLRDDMEIERVSVISCHTSTLKNPA